MLATHTRKSLKLNAACELRVSIMGTLTEEWLPKLFSSTRMKRTSESYKFLPRGALSLSIGQRVDQVQYFLLQYNKGHLKVMLNLYIGWFLVLN